MGHIHIEMTEFEAALMHSDIVSRPYLTWVMATPNGSKFCKPLARSLGKANEPIPRLWQAGAGFIDRGERLSADSVAYDIRRAWIGFDHRNEEYAEQLGECTKNSYNLTRDRFSVAPYNVLYGTLEWRAFDAAADWDEQEAHIAFIQRYVDVILTKTQKFACMPWGNGIKKAAHQKVMKATIDAYRNDKDRCAREFKEFIVNTLELPWKRYEWLLARNLDPAFEWGKRD
jgi:hypothetical protein